MRNNAIIVTEKATFRRFHGETKGAWGHKVYSFDRGDHWFRSRLAAFQDAQNRNRLWEAKAIKDLHSSS